MQPYMPVSMCLPFSLIIANGRVHVGPFIWAVKVDLFRCGCDIWVSAMTVFYWKYTNVMHKA